MRMRVLICAVSLILLPVSAFSQQNALSVGYGFGFLNPHQRGGAVEDDRRYNFFQLAYSRDIHLIQRLFLVLEPYLNYDHEPNGLDAGFGVLFRYYLPVFRENSVFFDAGGGGAYTTVDFKEQATHAMFILQGGIGWRWKRFFIEDRFRHYSNGGLSSPNHSINANIILVGVFF